MKEHISLQGDRKGTKRTFTTMKKVITQKISSYNLVSKNTTNTKYVGQPDSHKPA